MFLFVKYRSHTGIMIVKCNLTILHSERPKLYTILDFLSAIGLK